MIEIHLTGKIEHINGETNQGYIKYTQDGMVTEGIRTKRCIAWIPLSDNIGLKVFRVGAHTVKELVKKTAWVRSQWDEIKKLPDVQIYLPEVYCYVAVKYGDKYFLGVLMKRYHDVVQDVPDEIKQDIMDKFVWGNNLTLTKYTFSLDNYSCAKTDDGYVLLDIQNYIRKII